METKHTPGPWMYDQELIFADDTFQTHVCHIEPNTYNEQTRIANAKLIAAAPDMLELLLKIKDKIENHDEWWMSLPARGGFDLCAINDTIKRATE